MKIVDLLEYFDGIHAYWFNTHTKSLIEIGEGLSHAFDVIVNPKKYGFSKDELISSPVINDSIKNLLRYTRITVNNTPDLALDFDGDPSIVQFMGKRGWCRIVVDDNEININTNNLKNAQKTSIYLIDKYPNINSHVIEIETFKNNKSKRDYTTLRGNRLEFFIKYGAIPSQSIMEEDITQ
ncbi:MAG: hypothetical protein HC836_47555 [Richelia sp. RM2_1_2]|nr:hypothetical protein [Richelia sp. RM2_1_2]